MLNRAQQERAEVGRSNAQEGMETTALQRDPDQSKTGSNAQEFNKFSGTQERFQFTNESDTTKNR